MDKYNSAQFQCTNRDCKRVTVVEMPDKLPSPRDAAKMCPETCGGCGSPMDRSVGLGQVHWGLLFQ